MMRLPGWPLASNLAPLCADHTSAFIAELRLTTLPPMVSAVDSVEGRHPRHTAVNDVIHRSLSSAYIPSQLEQSGLYRSDGKGPDGCSIVPWRSRKVLVSNATCSDTNAPSHIAIAVRGAGTVAAQAERLKMAKCEHLDSSH